MQVLILNDKDVKELKEYAMDNIVDISNGIPEDVITVGDNPKHVILAGTTRIVYSIEKQPAGLCHHISVSEMGKKLPSVEIAEFVFETFGIDKTKFSSLFFEGIAVNIVQKIDEDKGKEYKVPEIKCPLCKNKLDGAYSSENYSPP